MRNYRLELDLQLFSQEKTEEATPKKKDEARKKGQIARSADLPGSLILIFVFMSFIMMGNYFKTHIMMLFGNLFEDWLLMDVTTGNIMSLFNDVAIEMLLILLPIFAVTVLVGVLGNVVQYGFLLTGDPLKMKLSKLNPINGFKQIFSAKTVVEFLKSVLKLLIVAVLVYMTISKEWNRILVLASLPIQQIFSFTAGLTIKLGIEIGVVLAVLALADFFYQRYEHNKSLRMSKQDIKDEYKKSEGDPIIKSRIRERQRKMAMQRMMQEVPKADVIITNPTHFAIALKYDATKMEAPRIIAKGMDHVALRIREIAKENGVVTMENKPLARALYERAEIGDVIPPDLFQAVAEVLAYVYKMKGRLKS
ncbi:flagellar biosynthesis protein FlhB [Paenibacillus sp. FSL A5-0031]|uniref:flagellar biosynthesis protein FlhB n=1 Tax=unclassified Paenibacillus TaxID=185978 RepID=UPI00096FF789|nr:flagellar biosynthesis protein FlhB [Paenibacillus sp. FSL A5-0031]OME80011.1 flagellar biosynthesis protein FlhB [Paenibacillus sp. FSL A5-0031]